MKYLKTYEDRYEDRTKSSTYITHPDSRKNTGKFFISPPLIQSSYEKKQKLKLKKWKSYLK